MPQTPKNRIFKVFMKKYKIIIAGSRSIDDYNLVERAIEYGLKQLNLSIDNIKEIVSGDAKGVDTLGATWAKNNRIPVKYFPAQWKNIHKPGAVVRKNYYGEYNARAGIDRNIEMGDYADYLVAIIKQGSSGTTHMIEYMESLSKNVYVWEI